MTILHSLLKPNSQPMNTNQQSNNQPMNTDQLANMEDKEQARPLALASPTVHPAGNGPTDEEAAGMRKSRFLHKRRCAIWCCGCCGAIVVALGVTILVLALTLFKIKDPELTMNSLDVNRLIVPGIGNLDNPVSVNATLTADISIKNPNVATFRFWNSTTDFYYGGKTVGVAYAPDGKVKAYRTARMNVTVDVLADRVLIDTNATEAAVFDGGVNMSSYTDISGKVNLLGVYKQDLDIQLNCTFTLDINDRTITNTVCQAHVR